MQPIIMSSNATKDDIAPDDAENLLTQKVDLKAQVLRDIMKLSKDDRLEILKPYKR